MLFLVELFILHLTNVVFMLRNVIKNHKILSTLCVAGIGGSVFLADENRRYMICLN